MPELPEVETVTTALREATLGSVVEKMLYLRPNLRDAIPVSTLEKAFLQQPITSISRRAKYIVIQSPKGYALLHLGMTGQIYYLSTDKPVHKHTHFIWAFSHHQKNFYLHYVDPRRFGRLSGGMGDDWQNHEFINELGLEPLDSLNLGKDLEHAFGNKSLPIKNAIMDARYVVGVGNIYACEALYLAGIKPTRQANSLTSQNFCDLGKSIKKVLKQAIKAGGTTIKDFKSLNGQKGYFSLQLNVYGREDEPCHSCGNKIEAVKLAGRTSWFCGRCQK